jgi:hypothetical protein
LKLVRRTYRGERNVPRTLASYFTDILIYCIFWSHLVVCHGFLVLSMFACTAIKLLNLPHLIAPSKLYVPELL